MNYFVSIRGILKVKKDIIKILKKFTKHKKIIQNRQKFWIIFIFIQNFKVLVINLYL